MDSTLVQSLVSLSPLSGFTIAALAVLLLFGVVLVMWSVKNEPSAGRRMTLYVLRILAGALALFFLLEPGMRTVKIARIKNRLAVLVDNSASMNFPIKPEGESRAKAANEWLATLASQMEKLQEKHVVEYFSFDPKLQTIQRLVGIGPVEKSNSTDIFSALQFLSASEQGGKKIAGAIVLSDGADNAEFKAALTERQKESLQKLGFPISTVLVGEDGLRDVAIDAVRVEDFAFVRNSVTAEIDIVQNGFLGRNVQVVLKRDGQLVGSKNVVLESEKATTNFTFSPDQTGRFVYTVTVLPLPDEAVKENNSRAFTLKVIRDRMRTLLVAGRPSWDERFLRGVLRQDANVDLVSFYILRSGDTQTGASDNELSLIPFPKDEIFREKIKTFDLMLVLNFGHKDPGTALFEYRRDIMNYVEGGGAIAYFGGDQSFFEAPQGRGPFDDVLPLQGVAPANLERFVPRLSAEGKRHPIMALSSVSGDLAQQLISELPPLDGLNVTQLNVDSTVLLEHPSLTVGGKSAPVIAVREIGRGRSMAVATDSLWRWSLPSAALGESGAVKLSTQVAPTRAHERFLANAMRWLVKDPMFTPISLNADAPAVEPGQAVGATVIVRKSDYTPLENAPVEIEVIDADTNLSMKKESAISTADGSLHFEFKSLPTGAYKLLAHASDLSGKPLGEANDAVSVRPLGSERQNIRVNAQLLKDIAEATKGYSSTIGDFSLSDVPLKEPPMVEVGRAKDAPLYDRWWYLVAFIAVLGVEWLLRRRFGYV
jgi:hypothetical protein